MHPLRLNGVIGTGPDCDYLLLKSEEWHELRKRHLRLPGCRIRIARNLHYHLDGVVAGASRFRSEMDDDDDEEVVVVAAESGLLLTPTIAAAVEAIDAAVIAEAVAAIGAAVIAEAEEEEDDDEVEETERLAIAKARYLAKYAAIRREQKNR
jgi:hypothetical protein